MASSIIIELGEKTCVVFGMPKRTIKLEAAMKVVPLQNVAKTSLEMIQ